MPKSATYGRLYYQELECTSNESQQDCSIYFKLPKEASVIKNSMSQDFSAKTSIPVPSSMAILNPQQGQTVPSDIRPSVTQGSEESANESSCLPLPTLGNYLARPKSHIRCGKRVIPRLKIDSSENALVKSPHESEPDFPCKKFFPSEQLKSISPTNDSIRKVRLSMDLNMEHSSIADSPTLSKVVPSKSGSADGRVEEQKDSSSRFLSTENDAVDNAFAEYARKNSELVDIVATIDPSMSKICGTGGPLCNNNRLKTKFIPQDRNGLVSGAFASEIDGKSKIFKDVRPNGLLEGNSTKSVNNPSEPEVGGSPGIPVNNSKMRFARVVPQKKVASNAMPTTTKSTCENVAHRQPVSLRSCTSNSQPPKLTTVRPQPQIFVSPHSAATQKRINVRYVPPYQWSCRAPVVNPSNHHMKPRASVYVPQEMPRYQVLYSGNVSKNYKPTIVRGNVNSSVNRQVGNGSNGVQCRIRGAAVVRIPARK